MFDVQKSAVALLASVGFGLVFFATPQKADAAIRFGADAIWVPLAADTVESGSRELDSDHKIASFGGAIHGGLGFNIFSMNLKLNYFNEGLKLTESGSTDSVRRDQLDINAMARIGVPGPVKLAFFGEGGASLSTDFDGLGYNVGLGAEYTLVSAGPVGLNLGTEGQYVNLPAKLNNSSTDNKSTRLLFYLGADFGL